MTYYPTDINGLAFGSQQGNRLLRGARIRVSSGEEVTKKEILTSEGEEWIIFIW